MRASLTDRVYAQIEQRLLAGDLAVNSVVSEQSLAAELGVSRTPVREAIKRFKSAGVVDQLHRYGTIIREPSLRDVIEAYDLREALETFAARRVAERAMIEDPTELNAYCDVLGELAEQIDDANEGERAESTRRFFESDARFHQALIDAARNQRISEMVSQARLFARVFGRRRHSETEIDREMILEVHVAHRRILDAVLAGKPDLAAEEMRSHIVASRDGAVAWMKRQMGI
jgi:DNA-binding GntR family transcriptional regulator